MSSPTKEEIEIAQIVLSGDEHIGEVLSLWWNEGNTLYNADDLNSFKKFWYDHEIGALAALHHFKTTGWNNNLRCITFTRTVERGEIHEVILEDERDDEKIHDWLIFSSLKDSITDWDDTWKEDGQYPLELGEYKLFAELIECLEKLYPLEKS